MANYEVTADVDSLLRAADFDAIRSLLGVNEVAHGSCYVSTSMVSAPAGTPIKIGTGSGATTSVSVSDFTHTSPGKLTYDGTVTKRFRVTASLTVIHDTDATIVQFYIGKNGTAVTGSRVDKTLVTGANSEVISLTYSVSLDTTDYIEIFADDNQTGNLTVTRGAVMIDAV